MKLTLTRTENHGDSTQELVITTNFLLQGDISPHNFVNSVFHMLQKGGIERSFLLEGAHSLTTK